MYQQGEIYSIYTSVGPILALSVDREYYISLTERQFDECKHIETEYYYFKTTSMYTLINSVCGLKSLLVQREESNACTVKYVKITNSIFNRLGYDNNWIYVAVNESIAIKCQDKDPQNLFLNGTGQLILNPRCKAYTRQSILTSTQHFVKNVSLQFNHFPVEMYPVTKNLTFSQQKLVSNYNFPKYRHSNKIPGKHRNRD